VRQREAVPDIVGPAAQLLQLLPGHLQRMALFMLNTGARDENVCACVGNGGAGARAGRSVFLVPARSTRASVLSLDLERRGWSIVEGCAACTTTSLRLSRRNRQPREASGEAYRRMDTVNTPRSRRLASWLAWHGAGPRPASHLWPRLRAAACQRGRALLLGHAIEDTATLCDRTVARLVEAANKVAETIDRSLCGVSTDRTRNSYATGHAERSTGYAQDTNR